MITGVWIKELEDGGSIMELINTRQMRAAAEPGESLIRREQTWCHQLPIISQNWVLGPEYRSVLHQL